MDGGIGVECTQLARHVYSAANATGSLASAPTSHFERLAPDTLASVIQHLPHARDIAALTAVNKSTRVSLAASEVAQERLRPAKVLQTLLRRRGIAPSQIALRELGAASAYLSTQQIAQIVDDALPHGTSCKKLLNHIRGSMQGKLYPSHYAYILQKCLDHVKAAGAEASLSRSLEHLGSALRDTPSMEHPTRDILARVMVLPDDEERCVSYLRLSGALARHLSADTELLDEIARDIVRTLTAKPHVLQDMARFDPPAAFFAQRQIPREAIEALVQKFSAWVAEIPLDSDHTLVTRLRMAAFLRPIARRAADVTAPIAHSAMDYYLYFAEWYSNSRRLDNIITMSALTDDADIKTRTYIMTFLHTCIAADDHLQQTHGSLGSWIKDSSNRRSIEAVARFSPAAAAPVLEALCLSGTDRQVALLIGKMHQNLPQASFDAIWPRVIERLSRSTSSSRYWSEAVRGLRLVMSAKPDTFRNFVPQVVSRMLSQQKLGDQGKVLLAVAPHVTRDPAMLHEIADLWCGKVHALGDRAFEDVLTTAALHNNADPTMANRIGPQLVNRVCALSHDDAFCLALTHLGDLRASSVSAEQTDGLVARALRIQSDDDFSYALERLQRQTNVLERSPIGAQTAILNRLKDVIGDDTSIWPEHLEYMQGMLKSHPEAHAEYILRLARKATAPVSPAFQLGNVFGQMTPLIAALPHESLAKFYRARSPATTSSTAIA